MYVLLLCDIIGRRNTEENFTELAALACARLARDSR